MAGSGEYSYPPIERVNFGPGSIVRLSGELDRLGSHRPFLITGKTIATKTGLVDQLIAATGKRFVGVFSGVRQHTPESDIAAAAKAAREANADSLISLGGGSPIDATKVVVKELSENFHHQILPHVAVPTTLSAAEFSHSAGVTDELARRKTGFRDLRMVPRIIMLDPELTVATPDWLWASTGIRSLDHAVESVYSSKHQPYVDTLALEAISLLFHYLKKSTRDPRDINSRAECQMAAWMSYAGALSVGTGISHAIGRVIGATWNIPHGMTSCITLAEVMRMEAKRDPTQLVAIAKAEGRNVEGISTERAAMSAADGVAELVEGLRLSKRLRDYKIEKSDLPRIANEVGSGEDSDILTILNNVW